MSDDLPDDLRVTPRVPLMLAFILRVLLVLAIAGVVALAVAVSIEADGCYVRWQAGR